MNVKDKTIIITGARRIGKTVAKELAKKGANLAIIYNSSQVEARQAVEECRGTGIQAEIFQANLSKHDDIKRVVEEIITKFGSIDGLVHMAAPYPKTPLGQISIEQFDEIMRSNFLLCFYFITFFC